MSRIISATVVLLVVATQSAYAVVIFSDDFNDDTGLSPNTGPAIEDFVPVISGSNVGGSWSLESNGNGNNYSAVKDETGDGNSSNANAVATGVSLIDGQYLWFDGRQAASGGSSTNANPDGDLRANYAKAGGVGGSNFVSISFDVQTKTDGGGNDLRLRVFDGSTRALQLQFDEDGDLVISNNANSNGILTTGRWFSVDLTLRDSDYDLTVVRVDNGATTTRLGLDYDGDATFSSFDSMTFSLFGNDTFDAMLDRVHVEAVPEPSTYLVFGGLMLCFGAAGWWRKRRQAAA